MSGDTIQLTASTVVNGEKVSITIPVPGPGWTAMGEDYLITARTRLATEVIKHLEVAYEAVRDAGDGNE